MPMQLPGTSLRWHTHFWLVVIRAPLCTRTGHSHQCIYCTTERRSHLSPPVTYFCNMRTKHGVQLKEVLVELLLPITFLQLFSIIYAATKAWTKCDHQASWFNQIYQSLLLATHSSTLAWKITWTEEPGRATVHGVAKSRTRLSDFTFTFCLLRVYLREKLGSVMPYFL